MLISDTGKAQICDYGLSPIIQDPVMAIAASSQAAEYCRWLAPEVDPHKDERSKLADIFAFAMLAVEVFTGKEPFGDMKKKSVVLHIADGGRPEKPSAADQFDLTTEMWEFIQKCWAQKQNKRPTIDEVVSTWEGFVNRYVVSCSDSSAS